MTLFEKKFKNIEKLLGQSNITSYEELVELLKINMESVQNDADKDAVIILGYSGNGKTTWAKKFCKRNPRYKVISWDLEFMRRFKGRRYAEISSDEQLLAMGEAIEDGSDQNLVIDGNYLNLPLRTAIINTLHEYGYNIYLADLTPQFEETLAFRIADEVDRYQRMPKYANCSYEDIKRRVTKAIYSFKQDEENRSAFSEQVRCGVVDLGVEKVIGPKDLEMTEVKRNFRK